MTVLQIGAGGVGWVVAHKCAQHNDQLGDLVIVSRRPEATHEIIDDIRARGSAADPGRAILFAPADAHDVGRVADLIAEYSADIVLNVGPPWVNVDVMEACLKTHTPYVDTSVGVDLFSEGQQVPEAYDLQWVFRQRFADAGIAGVLGAGFDPGVVSAFATHALDVLLDTIETIDVLDINAGDHGRPFATNFDPETNFLEIQADSFRWEDGKWLRAPCHTRSITMDLPEVGAHTLYSMAHDEVRSLVEYMSARHVEFWMSFSEDYLRHFRVLRDLGFLSPDPVTTANGVMVPPLEIVKAVLPNPKSLAATYRGKTFIGTLLTGTRGAERRAVLLYNVCDHQAAYAEVGSQAISYTAGVPAVAAALALLQDNWAGPGVHNIEQLDPAPFLVRVSDLGLPWHVADLDPASLPVPA
jgi:carboxynorspermidine synthase